MIFFFSSRRRHTRLQGDWSSDVCSSDLDAKGLVLITAATVAYGYLMKPLGLVIATAALVYISALGGHEFKWKEVSVLFVILIIFSVLVFVKGLTLPFPICPEFIANCPIR